MYYQPELNQMDKSLLRRGFLWSRDRKPFSCEFVKIAESENLELLKDRSAHSYQYWIDNPFEYRVNSWGHRGSEFQPGGLVMLGCSYTWGWGMREEWSWPWLIGQRLGQQVNCLGYPGQGGDRAAMLALGWIRELEPCAVYFLDLFTTRRTWLMNWDPGETIMMNHDDPRGSEQQLRMLQKIAQSDAQDWFDQQRNLAVIEQECRSVGAALYHLDWDSFRQRVADHPRDRDSELQSRDQGNHPSREEHELIAEAMLDLPDICDKA